MPSYNNKEKKRACNEKILKITYGPFAPAVFFFSIYGSMGKKCRRFYSRLPDLLKEKRDLPKLIIITQIYTKLCLVLWRFNLLCSRGFQITYRTIAEFECEIKDLHNIYY